MSKICLIVAVDKNNGIGKNGSLPWTIKLESQYFYDITSREYIKGKKNVLIMGRKTYNSCSSIIDRDIICITSKYTDCMKTTNSVGKAINCSRDYGKIFICGGRDVYKESMNYVDEIYMTKIDDDYNCDVKFLEEEYLKNYKIFFEKSFRLKDENTDKYVMVKFIKMSKDENKYYEENKYLDILYKIITYGHFRNTRNSNTASLFSNQLEFNLDSGKIPLLTTKKVFFRGIFEELMWFMSGKTDSKILSKKGIKIWEPNTTKDFLNLVGLNYEEGDIGELYSFNYRHYGEKYDGCNKDYTGKGFDQIQYCIELLKKDPYSRRILFSAFNPGTAKNGVLYPCHVLCQFGIDNHNELTAKVYMRSSDVCCGLPFNVCQYALLVHLLVHFINKQPDKILELKPGRVILDLGDTHIYDSHTNNAIRQILRDPYDFPKIKINSNADTLWNYKYEEIELIDYNNCGELKFVMIP